MAENVRGQKNSMGDNPPLQYPSERITTNRDRSDQPVAYSNEDRKEQPSTEKTTRQEGMEGRAE